MLKEVSTRHCLNCTAPLTRFNESDFCSRQCSDEYWTMQIEKEDKTMAHKTEVIVTLVDDLTGEEFTEAEGETFNFAFDGERYELDLSHKNAALFRKAVAKYISAARVVTGKRTSEPSEASAVRAWAHEAGKEVNDRGRIPQALVDEYRAAQNA